MAAGDGRDIIAIGASAGGIAALQHLVAALPKDLPASIFVVLHTAPTGRYLAPLIDRRGPLPAAYAEDGETIRRGRIYVAVPDRHLVVRDGHMHLTRTPKENWTRPSINPLFRSVAQSCGPRAIGIILTGMLDNGTAGLLAMEAAGCTTVVQEPGDADFPGMPQSALRYLDPDHVLPLAAIPPLLIDLVGTPKPASAHGRAGVAPIAHAAVPHAAGPPAASTDGWIGDPPEDRHRDRASGFTCPECGGALWETVHGGYSEFVCRTGHRFSTTHLSDAQALKHTDLLEAALRAVGEELELAERLLARGHDRGVEREQVHRQATRVRELRRLSSGLRHLLRDELVREEGPQAPAD